MMMGVWSIPLELKMSSKAIKLIKVQMHISKFLKPSAVRVCEQEEEERIKINLMEVWANNAAQLYFPML